MVVVVVVLVVVEMVEKVMGMGLVKKEEVVLMVLWNDDGDGLFGGEREEWVHIGMWGSI